MPAPAVVRFYADLHCPYAYLAAYRLRRVLPEFEGRVVVAHKSLAIEYVDAKVTPKHVLDAETPYILLEEPGIPYAPWHAREWEWPVTMWPAFEAVKCAERQGWRLANELDWALRVAFWAESRCISMRHVILDVARRVPGLDLARFERDFDAGVAKGLVMEEAREGWEKLDLQVSPTFVLPDGAHHANPAAPHVELDADDHMKLVGVTPAPARGEAALDHYRRMLKSAVA